MEKKINLKIYLALYCLVLMSIGLYHTSLGPLIPFLAQTQHHKQTDYSFLFISITLGNVIGIVFYKFMTQESRQQANSQHQYIMAGCFGFSIALPLFIYWQSTIGQIFCMVMLGFGAFVIDTAAGICLVYVSSTLGGKWITFAHGFYGIGALISPLFVRYLQTNTYNFYPIIYLSIAAMAYYYPTPRHQLAQYDINNNPQSQKIGQLTHQTPQDNSREWKQISGNIQFQLCLAMLCISGMQVSYGGWISTYAVLSGATNQIDATIFSTIFWISSTACRFLVASVSMSETKKMRYHVLYVLLFSFVALCLIEVEFFSAAMYLSSFSLGAATSGIFPLILSIPAQFGAKYKPSQIANIMTTAVLASGVVPWATGMLMKIQIDLMFYWFLAMGVIMYVDMKLIFKGLYNTRNQNGEQYQMKEKLVD